MSHGLIINCFILGIILPVMASSQKITPESTYQNPEGVFFNPFVKEEDHPGFSQMMKWFWERKSPDTSDSTIGVNIPREAPDMSRIFHPNDSLIQVTWIGHSTFLIQLDGLNFLTDPIFSERCSPLEWIGPKRFTPPSISIDSLPPIDFVILSHNHYDHLDLPTAHALGKWTKWFVPLGVKEIFESEGLSNVEELDWWGKTDLGPLEIVCTPNQHFSGRSPLDRNESLWGSWAVIGSHQRIWFAGDTGYNPFQFKEIGENYGPFDVALIPIGAYNPEWIMRDHHVNPSEAVSIHRYVRSKFSIGMHWGTFTLTDEPIDEPPKLLKDALQLAFLLDSSSFITVPQGRTTRVK